MTAVPTGSNYFAQPSVTNDRFASSTSLPRPMKNLPQHQVVPHAEQADLHPLRPVRLFGAGHATDMYRL